MPRRKTQNAYVAPQKRGKVARAHRRGRTRDSLRGARARWRFKSAVCGVKARASDLSNRGRSRRLPLAGLPNPRSPNSILPSSSTTLREEKRTTRRQWREPRFRACRSVSAVRRWRRCWSEPRRAWRADGARRFRVGVPARPETRTMTRALPRTRLRRGMRTPPVEVSAWSEGWTRTPARTQRAARLARSRALACRLSRPSLRA